MASAKENASTGPSRANQVLHGQSNWLRWYPVLKADARADDTWDLFTGDEVLLVKPKRKDYLDRTQQPQVGSDGKVVGVEITRRDYDYKLIMDEYKDDTSEYDKQHERVRRANKMLHDRIDDSMRSDIEDILNPKEALERLASIYKIQDSRAIQHTYDQLDTLTLAGCDSMMDYLNKMRQLKSNLTTLKETCTDAQVINKIIKGLPDTYKSWVERYHDIQSDPDAIKPTLKSIEAQLIAKEATMPKINLPVRGFV